MNNQKYSVKTPEWYKQMTKTSNVDMLDRYIPPIKTLIGQAEMDVENGIVKAVQKVGFDVDKEELTKALQYDRGQYDKGYKDGCKQTAEKFMEILDEVLVNYVPQRCIGEILEAITEGKV